MHYKPNSTNWQESTTVLFSAGHSTLLPLLRHRQLHDLHPQLLTAISIVAVLAIPMVNAVSCATKTAVVAQSATKDSSGRDLNADLDDSLTVPRNSSQLFAEILIKPFKLCPQNDTVKL